MNLQELQDFCSQITMNIIGTDFTLRVEHDIEYGRGGRIFLQVVYYSPCTKTGELKEWHGRKWYLSRHMLPDEIIKTAYCAFEAAVKHEIMEGFKVSGVVLFNPHVDYRELLKVSHKEVKRESSLQ